MKRLSNILTISLLVFFMQAYVPSLYAQSGWTANEKALFVENIKVFIKSCDKNFSDIKGGEVPNDLSGEKTYISTKEIPKFNTYVVTSEKDNLYMLTATIKLDAMMDVTPAQYITDRKAELPKATGQKVVDSDAGQIPTGDPTVARVVGSVSSDKKTQVLVIQGKEDNAGNTVITITVRHAKGN